jgi:hyaluronan synthase
MTSGSAQRGRPRHTRIFDRGLQWFAAVYLLAVLGGIVYYRSTATHTINHMFYLAVYGIVVAIYLLTRFALSLFYKPHPDAGIEPRIAIVAPGFNEEDAVRASLNSLLAVDYPADKLEIVAINDGSTDNTLEEMNKARGDSRGRIRVINFADNRGKRAAMAAGIRATDAEIIVVVDSDSMLDRDSLRKIVQPFADDRIGAVSGHTDVANADENWLSKMQAVRYYIAFRVMKAAESVFGCVTCCPGCFSAYRRDAIMPKLDWWENQHFLGVPSTFGDDRSLTNCVLRHWRVTYQYTAHAVTIVPTGFYKFLRQQARWKRSWAREAVYLLRVIWRKPAPAQFAVYVSVLLPLLAPIVCGYALIVSPILLGHPFSILYPLGIYSMALTYGLYYAASQREFQSRWWFGVVFVGFYLALLLWQTYWAIGTLRTAKWGTRPSTAGLTPEPIAEPVAEGVLA